MCFLYWTEIGLFRHLLAVDCWSFSERDAFWWKLGASTVKIHWHARNCANQKIWLQCQIYIPGMWGTGSGLRFQKYLLFLEKHTLPQSLLSLSSYEAHDHLGWTVKIHCSCDTACMVTSCSLNYSVSHLPVSCSICCMKESILSAVLQI